MRMERWSGRTAVVTGASAGIGAAIAYQLLDAGVNVVGLARRVEKIQDAVDTARKDAQSRGRTQTNKAPSPGKLHCVKCDVSKEADILSAFKWIQEHTDGVHILVNNAGVVGQTKLTETNTDEWRRLFDINVLGLSICTREAVQQMKAKGIDDGHIVHISSVAGHKYPSFPGLEMYSATKHSVRVLTEGLRKELVASKSKIRVTEVSPGLVRTDILDSLKIDQNLIWLRPHLFPEDVADAVLYALGTPPHVQIHEIMVKPIGEES